ncbi:MAG: hypothetical protein L0Z55_08705, partial [Planctomycetes bacterium]|nr:hypothetical protein [Planctomycetota bacterium]
PPEYYYMGWDGNLILREDPEMGLWQRFKALLTPSATAAGGVPGSGAGPRAISQTGLVLEQPPEGFRRYRFDTLAAAGNLDFYYTSRGLFWFIDFLAFLFAVAASHFVLRRARAPRDTAIALVLATLALTWFASGPGLEFAISLFLGCFAVAAYRVLLYVRGRVQAGRAVRLALAPDPFLEDAPAKPPAAQSPPPQQPPPPAAPPATGGSGDAQ